MSHVNNSLNLGNQKLFGFRRAYFDVVKAAYCILYTPRCGANLLMDHLRHSKAGNPLDFFGFLGDRAPMSANPLGLNCGSFHEYLFELISSRVVDGVFGFKLRIDDLRQMGEYCKEEFSIDLQGDIRILFPNVQYFRLFRLNSAAQAISLWRARVSNVWSRQYGDPAPPQPDFDGPALVETLRETLLGEYCLNQLTTGLGSGVIPLTFEDLVAHPDRVVGKVISECAIPHTSFRKIDWLAPLRDSYSEELELRLRDALFQNHTQADG